MRRFKPLSFLAAALLSAPVWLAAWTSAADSHPKAAFVLGHGPHQLTLNSNGALVAWAGKFDQAEAAPTAVAGEIRYQDKALKLVYPQVSRTGDQLSFSYRWPAEPGLEVIVRHQAIKDHGAFLWTREVQIRSAAKLASDLTVSLQCWPRPLPVDTWLPLLNGTSAALGTNEAAAFRFAGALPGQGALLALPMVSVPALGEGSRILIAADPYFSTDSAEKPSCYFLVLGEMAGAANRRSRKSERPSSCHWTSSPASKSSAAASGKGMLT